MMEVKTEEVTFVRANIHMQSVPILPGVSELLLSFVLLVIPYRHMHNIATAKH